MLLTVLSEVKTNIRLFQIDVIILFNLLSTNCLLITRQLMHNRDIDTQVRFTKERPYPFWSFLTG